MAARRYLDASLGQFAMLRAGGVEPGRLGLLFACTLFWGVVPGMALGAGLAWLAQTWLVDAMARGFGLQLPPGDAAPLAFGVAVAAAGLAASFAPSLWALLRLAPVAIWQRSGAASQAGGQLLQWGPLGLLLAVLAVFYSSDLTLSASVLAGILAAGLWAWLAARLAMALAARALPLATGLLRSALASLVMRRTSLQPAGHGAGPGAAAPCWQCPAFAASWGRTGAAPSPPTSPTTSPPTWTNPRCGASTPGCGGRAAACGSPRK